ncbi:MAG: EAL domain-containing protein [Sulfuricella sp.]|nr:EAL domain-containing protein [Sulfuricella sp.]
MPRSTEHQHEEGLSVRQPDCRSTASQPHIDKAGFTSPLTKLPINGKGLEGDSRRPESCAAPLSNRAGEITAMLSVTRDISKDGRAKKAHRESDQRFYSTFNQAAVGMAHFTPEGRWLLVNHKLCDIVGYTEQELLAMSCEDTSHPDDVEASRDHARRLLRGEAQNYSMQKRYIRKDGSQIWINQTVSLVRELSGQPKYFIAVIEDISKRRQAEEALHVRERALVSSMNGIMITDAVAAHHPIIFVNPAFERITGYSAEEALGRGGSLLLGDDTGQIEAEEVRAALREEREAHVVLRDYRKDGSMFWNELSVSPVRDDAGRVTHFVGVINDITERKRYEEQLEHQTNYDPLTGLANRNLLNDRLNQAIVYANRSGRQVAALLLDLDRFKVINDSLGHGHGDALLKQIARGLNESACETDTVARLGGDEFAVILTEVSETDDVVLVAGKILDHLSLPMTIAGQEVFVTASIGISLYPKDGENGDSLLKNADVAMYRAKEMGRNRFCFYSPEMNARAMHRLNMEASLRHALERDELYLHYQPKVDLQGGGVTGVEALVRWRHPELGTVSPAEFIPLAEETELILPIGEWVLKTACAQNKAWQDAGLPPVSVAVNLSARQFRQEGLVHVVRRVLEESGLAPECLELELTESMLIQDAETAAVTMKELKSLGVKFSLDDFGTGYSSLSYLKRFPFDSIKIDKSFVGEVTTDPGNAALVKAIIAMAGSLNMKVVAEGVETEGQMDFLATNQCDSIQGFYYSRPLAVEDAATMLRENRQVQLLRLPGDNPRGALLIVDDEANIVNALKRLLRRDGYRILTASSPQEGFELLASHKVGVVLSDQRMPSMNGTEFLRLVKELYPHTVRIVLSRYTDLESVTDAINEGAIYKFLTKPWDDAQLRDNILEAFQRQEMAQENERLNHELKLANQELERLVEDKTLQVIRNTHYLQVSQEVLEHMPVAVVGVDEEGMIAIANRKADELFGGASPLLGSMVEDSLPRPLLSCLAEFSGEERGMPLALEDGHRYHVWCRAMGTESRSKGALLTITPENPGC